MIGGKGKGSEEGFSAACSCSSCDYRSLYEGALASLSDMASSQRRSVERLGRSRSALVSLMMQNFPFQARAMERSSGRRLSDLSEDEMVSAISAAIRSRKDTESEQIVELLVERLASEGVQLPEDRTLWREALSAPRTAHQEEEKPAAEQAGSVPDRPEPTAATTPALPALFTSPKHAPSAGAVSASSAPKPPEVGPEPAASADDAPEPDPRRTSPSDDPRDEASGERPDETVASPARPAEPAPPSALRAPATLFQPPLRPGIPEKRQSRRRSSSPGPETAPGDSAPDLDDRVRGELLAAVSAPRPVFTSDLVQVAGSEGLVDAWEAECRASPASSPVRFIAPKSRHRHRGRLVVPSSSPTPSKDWWSRCVALYRAGRLYELAVVLRHVQDDVLAVQLADEHTVLRIRGESGSSALVVLLSPLPQEGGSDPLGDLLEELSQERLDAIVLLSASGEKDARESVARAASRAVAARELSMAAPVVAAVSWEYVEDPKSASVFVKS